MTVTLIITALLIALDQFTKYLATTYLAPVGTAPLIPHVMELRYVLNDGVAFSMFSGGNRWPLVVVTGIALAALLGYILWKKPARWVERASLALILAGGFGNWIDRLINGAVVDFFATTFMDFAVFNVADCFICIGAALLCIGVALDEYRLAKAKKESDGQKESGKQDET